MRTTRAPDADARKARGAFFTPTAIADYLADWAVRDDPTAKVLDPTCGEAVFLLAAARRLRDLGCPTDRLDDQVIGVDLHGASLQESMALLEAEGLDARLVEDDFFNIPTPAQIGSPLPEVDAVIGNPPFIRYQSHVGEARRRSATAALAQGVRLSGLASSWASLLVHACGFLKPEGRLAMVLPAELLTVHYAEPVRRWLRQRFASVHLVMFERLQFADALENVVLVVAKGAGGCDAFSLHYLEDAGDLHSLHAFDNLSVTPADDGKWTDLWLPNRQRQLFKRVTDCYFAALGEYGSPELGTVTGNNGFFTLSEQTREGYGIDEISLVRISPPGTRHLKGLSFTPGNWTDLKGRGDRVWMLNPDPDSIGPGLQRYLGVGSEAGVPKAYKCQVRQHWFRPPTVPTPDLFFTYMSHRYPRLITNSAKVKFVNSMHGIRLRAEVPKVAKQALPLLALNSATMLGAEVHGRSYGGGILKMEPGEAARLPVPKPEFLVAAWERLRPLKSSLDRQLRDGRWTNVAKLVDDILLKEAMGLSSEAVAELHTATRSLRERRLRESRSV